MNAKLRSKLFCACGETYCMITTPFVETINEDFDGIWFNCAKCNTTRFIPRLLIESMDIKAAA